MGGAGKIWKGLLPGICLSVLLAGCGDEEVFSTVVGADKEETSQAESGLADAIEDSSADAAGLDGEESEAAGQQDEEKDAGESGVLPSDGTVTLDTMTVTIPESWQEACLVKTENDSIIVYQKASYVKEEGMGFICSIAKLDEPEYDYAGATPLAYTDQHFYILQEPTDVPYDTSDPAISTEYHRLSLEIDVFADSLEIKEANVHGHADEYMLPMSEYAALREDQLLNFSGDSLWIARNEIFARHGYIFDTEYLNLYFGRFSWYEPSSDYSEASLSQVEKDNINVIRAMEEKYAAENPYPQKQKTNSSFQADLDGDGQKEDITYKPNEDSFGGADHAQLLINGSSFDLGTWGIYLECADTEECYVTDISPFYDGLEVAVLDYGPSDDPVTHFFTWDGNLVYLGSMSGFPMKDKGGVDGFLGGAVQGTIRTDLIETCYSYATWWYDYNGQTLEFQDTGWYTMVPERGHRLYEELPVYSAMSTDASMTTIPAQEQVFFMGTDGEKWILVKGKDGTSGYVPVTDGKIDTVGKPATEVFGDLSFYD